MRTRKNINRYQHIFFAVCLAFLFFAPELTVQAATGNVSYGSENYQWELNTTNAIGVYINGDEALADYEVCLSYDSSVLRYIDGASEQQGNLLYIRGSGTATQYRAMLHFETLKSGDTQLQVVSAVGHTGAKPVSVSGNEVLATEAEDFRIDISARAPISISQPASVRLVELVTEPQNIVDFAADKLEYNLEVPAEVEKLGVSYISEDEQAIVTVSDTDLRIGENTITVTVANANLENRYTIKVIRQEPIETIEPTEESAEPIEETPEETVEPESEVTEPENSDDLITEKEENAQIFVLVLGCVLVALLAGLYLVYILKLRLRERELRKEKSDDIDVIDMESTVIKVSNVTMKFKMAKDEASSLKEYFIRGFTGKNKYSYLKALNNISFEVKQGEVVGIIGTNGSGKSTMLKILSGALKPTKGHVDVDFSRVQMLTLGTGFDMELTARENVYLNGSIIGYTKEYIDEKYDEIVKFAELEGFMDERMKNFSSGMVSRLGFAIATMRDTPDILILDEVLSVGDMFFRRKSEKRIREMIHSGATILIVSHSMDTIVKNCTKVIWIEKGVLQMVGDPKTVCEAYRRL